VRGGKSGGNTAATPTAFRAFVRTWGLFRNVMESYFAGFGLSGGQWGILRSLHAAEQSGETHLRQTDLAERLLVRPPSITSVVDHLERLGLIARRTAASDRRAKEVSLTPGGRRLTARVLRRHPAQMRMVLGAFSTAEIRTLQSLMERMARHLSDREERRARTRKD
jgi:DNA-binding MarR family transcriptional regulator